MAVQKNGSELKERSGEITMKGNPLTLLGPELKIGDTAPDVVLINNDLEPVSLSAYKGKICIISSLGMVGNYLIKQEEMQYSNYSNYSTKVKNSHLEDYKKTSLTATGAIGIDLQLLRFFQYETYY